MKARNNWKLVVNVNTIGIWMFCCNIAVTSEIILYYAWLNTCSWHLLEKKKPISCLLNFVCKGNDLCWSYVHFMQLRENCRFVPDISLENFTIKSIVNNVSTVNHLPKKISIATKFLLERRNMEGINSASFNVAL